jgi:hypothetical protein
MAAECKVNCCGVQAIGRCARCGRAMCASHRALYSINECRECESARYKAQADASFAANERHLAAKQRVHDIARHLVDAGFPPDCFLKEGSRFKDRWSGGQKQVRDRSSDVYGWFVGEYSWREQEVGDVYGGGRTVERRERTYVTAHGGIAREGIGRYIEDQLVSNGYEFWEEIASKMIAIARQHGIPIT